MHQKEFLDLLLDPVESGRVTAVADVLFRVESYLRGVSLGLAGMCLKHDLTGDQSRDIWATRTTVEEVALWLAAHHAVLYEYVNQSTPKAEVERVEGEPSERVVH